MSEHRRTALGRDCRGRSMRTSRPRARVAAGATPKEQRRCTCPHAAAAARLSISARTPDERCERWASVCHSRLEHAQRHHDSARMRQSQASAALITRPRARHTPAPAHNVAAAHTCPPAGRCRSDGRRCAAQERAQRPVPEAPGSAVRALRQHGPQTRTCGPAAPSGRLRRRHSSRARHGGVRTRPASTLRNAAERRGDAGRRRVSGGGRAAPSGFGAAASEEAWGAHAGGAAPAALPWPSCPGRS